MLLRFTACYVIGIFTGVFLLILLSFFGVLSVATSVSERKVTKSIKYYRVFIDNNPYIAVIGFDGGSNSYRGGAKLLNNKGNCSVAIVEMTYSSIQENGNFSYIFPEREKCMNVI